MSGLPPTYPIFPVTSTYDTDLISVNRPFKYNIDPNVKSYSRWPEYGFWLAILLCSGVVLWGVVNG